MDAIRIFISLQRICAQHVWRVVHHVPREPHAPRALQAIHHLHLVNHVRQTATRVPTRVQPNVIPVHVPQVTRLSMEFVKHVLEIAKVATHLVQENVTIAFQNTD